MKIKSSIFKRVLISLLSWSSLIALCFPSCTETSVDLPKIDDPSVEKDSFFVMSYDINGFSMIDSFDSVRTLGTVQNPDLNEISGMAAGYAIPGSLWTEEDSGNENIIYLMDKTGKHLGAFAMPSVNNRDWEDISVAPGPLPDKHYIYLADIGDNFLINSKKNIYRFPEPSFSGKTLPVTEDITQNIDKISFQYPDGIKNAEAIIVDPQTKDIYVISKEEVAVIYVARYPQSLTKVITLSKLGVLPIPSVSSANISPDGTEILIKNYSKVLYWKRTGTESIGELLQRTPLRLIYKQEPQGEAITWATDGSGFYTTSEKALNVPPTVNFYKRK